MRTRIYPVNLVRGRGCNFEKVSDLGKASDLRKVKDLGKACDFGKVSDFKKINNLRRARDFEKVSDLEKAKYLALSATVITYIITLCMKLSWFCHTNSGQLFCNCPVFVIALVPIIFYGDETCCHSGVASKWLKTQSVSSPGQNTAISTQTEVIKSLIVQCMKKLEKQWIHHFNLINYDYVNIMGH